VKSAAILLAGTLLGSCSGSPSAPTPAEPRWWSSRTFYEIFVRSFADDNNDGVGDLQGLIKKLDYLNDGDPATTTDLGVGGIWLMPIFPSPSYHGYDVMNYRGVNVQYGTLADVDELVQKAHQRGIAVILDMVLNHSSSQHPWFLDSRQGATAPRRDWYLWRDTDPGWSRPTGGGTAWNPYGGSFFYAAFNGTMPDLNLTNPAVEQELVASMKFWLARGVDGFRLDAVRYFVENGPGSGLVDTAETHAFLKRIRAALAGEYPEVLLVAEAWTTTLEAATTYWGNGDEAHLAFSFQLAGAILGSVQAGNATDLSSALQRTEAALAGKDRRFEAPFLANHDQLRVMRALNGSAVQARAAAAVLFAMPGTPFVYYGEELGMQGYFSDPEKRTPFRWTSTAPGYGFTTAPSTWFTSGGYGNGTEAAGVDLATQQADPGSLWRLYRELIALRKARPALALGEATRPAITGGGAGLFALLRTFEGKRVLFVANLAAGASGAFTVDVAGTPAVLLAEGLDAAPSTAGGKVSVSGLAGRSFAYLSLD
jgi:glycosidase